MLIPYKGKVFELTENFSSHIIKTDIIWHCLYVKSKENYTNELIYEIEKDSDIEKKKIYGYQRWKVGRDELEEFGSKIYTLLFIK